MSVKSFDAVQKECIFSAWTHGDSKRQIAKNFETSARTVGRIIDEELARVKDGGMTKRGKPKPATQHVEPKMIGSESFITVVDKDGQVYTAASSHPNFAKAHELLQVGDAAGVVALLSTEKALAMYSKGNIKIMGYKLTYRDIVFDSTLANRIIEEMHNNRPFEHLINFFEKLMLNPSRDAVYQLYGFLEHNDIEICDDGDFFAWKRVNDGYKDFRTNTFDNSPGTVVTMPRNMVCEDKNKTCAPGLHAAAASYIPCYAGGQGRILKMKINPRDVVAIPEDYNNAKMRVCQYLAHSDCTSSFVMAGHRY